MPTTDRKLRVLPCHASQDKPIVRESYERLFSESWIDPWLDEEGRLCYLLFGTGRVLEEAVLEVLRLMEFTAESYEDSESEFDVIFSSSEGRFLGEVEGKTAPQSTLIS